MRVFIAIALTVILVAISMFASCTDGVIPMIQMGDEISK